MTLIKWRPEFAGDAVAMYLNQTAEYALRAVASLAALPPGVAARANDLSTDTGIPVHYLSKILRKLVVAGILKSQKGHGGGFCLARPAGKVRFIHVLQATDWQANPNHCAFGRAGCDERRPCRLHTTWGPLKGAVNSWAQSMTFADTLSDEEKAAKRQRRPQT